MKYIGLGESLMTNIALASPCAIFTTRLLPHAVYNWQYSAKSNARTHAHTHTATYLIATDLHNLTCNY